MLSNIQRSDWANEQISNHIFQKNKINSDTITLRYAKITLHVFLQWSACGHDCSQHLHFHLLIHEKCLWLMSWAPYVLKERLHPSAVLGEVWESIFIVPLITRGANQIRLCFVDRNKNAAGIVLKDAVNCSAGLHVSISLTGKLTSLPSYCF